MHFVGFIGCIVKQEFPGLSSTGAFIGPSPSRKLARVHRRRLNLFELPSSSLCVFRNINPQILIVCKDSTSQQLHLKMDSALIFALQIDVKSTN
uniref:Uncharacterized protein n=1 Tax=Romanomermis culicivorax TaxID=13658 RepID=A0A915K8J3_ROMCU